MAERKQKRRELEPVRICENGEVRYMVSNKLWHKVTSEGLEFRCKCPRHTEIITWADVRKALLILAQHRDELWNFICDGQSLLLALPSAHHSRPSTRLVGVIWPAGGILTFVS